MEPLFKLMLVRPAVELDPIRPQILLQYNTSFQATLSKAFVGDKHAARDPVRAAALNFVGGLKTTFISSPDQTPMAASLSKIDTAIKGFIAAGKVTRDQFTTAVSSSFGSSLPDVVKQAAFAEARSRLADSILAIKYLPEKHTIPIEKLCAQLRDLELLEVANEDSSFPKDSAALQAQLNRPFLLPDWTQRLGPSLSAASFLQQSKQSFDTFTTAQQGKIEGLLTSFRQHLTAIDELNALSNEHLQVAVPQAKKGITIPEEFSMATAMKNQLSFVNQLSALTLKQLSTAIQATAGSPQLGSGSGSPQTRAQAAAPQLTVDPLLLQDIAGARSAALLADKILDAGNRALAAGTPDFTPPAVPFKSLKDSARTVLTSSTLAILDQNPKIKTAPFEQVVNTLQSKATGLAQSLALLYPTQTTIGFTKIGGTTVRTVQVSQSNLDWANSRVPVDYTPIWAGPPAPAIPTSHSNIEPVGVADLIIVKQQLKRYQGADVAHIENVLKGESKSTDFTTKHTVDTTTSTQQETTTVTQNAQESTTRYEMTQESSNVIKDDTSLKAGAQVSGSYGPTVSFSASVEGSSSRSSEQANKSGATFAKSVTDKASTNITNRVLQSTSTTVTDEVTDEEKHTIDNGSGSGEISGVYQWVNKVYEAQMWNYGKRAMFDLMVPEPAAVMIDAMVKKYSSATTLTKPPDFNIKLTDVTPLTYPKYVATYGATDVKPPPPTCKTYSFTHSDGQGNQDHSVVFTKDASVAIDDGYAAQSAAVAILWHSWADNNSIEFSIDDVVDVWNNDFGSNIYTLNDIVNTVSISLVTSNLAAYSFTVSIAAKLTDEGLGAWQMDTFSKLKTAHDTQVSDYEDQVAKLQLSAGVAIQGNNPDANLVTMRTELKRLCVSILTEQEYDSFGAVNSFAASGPPTVDFAAAANQGPYVRFFESAFEWEEMSWVYYPYFWGRKSAWTDKFSYDDPDPAFNEFLKAGFARVQVPARLGFEAAIAHFMQTGDVWVGAALPQIGDPLYLSIQQEIADRLQEPQTEYPQGPSWDVRVPTSLVHLRSDDLLPTWVPDPNNLGQWIEGPGQQ